jgi:2-polyprenyl-6-methoxyphenol hydroxylase-like FAD-dependent oxidoreductase
MLSGLEDRVEFGMAVRGVEMDPSGATLYFSDGASARAALVVGADGTDSQVRATLLPDCPVVDSGTWGIYGKSPLMKNGEPLIPAALKDSGRGILALAGAGRFFFCTAMDFDNPPQEIFERLVPDQEPPITEDYLMWAVGLPNQLLPDDAWQLRPGALHRLALDGCRDFHPLLRNFIEQADVDYTILTALSVATRPKQWTASRVTLLGDAVHTMPPTGGHGGNTALRDAALLAAKLQAAVDADTPVEEAVTAYQREMLAYAFEEVDSSVAMLRRAALTNPLARVAVLRMLPALRSRMSGPLVPE